MDITVRKLTADILDAVRKEAENQNISQGAIAICYEPLISGLNDWLGILDGAYSSTHTFPVVPGKDTYFREDYTEVADCAGVVAMKIAAAKRSEIEAKTQSFEVPTRAQCTSGALDKSLVCDGRINWKGCVLYPLGVLTNGGPCGHAGHEAVNIYVAVSGGTEEQDEAAAWAALPVLQKLTRENLGFMLQRNFYD